MITAQTPLHTNTGTFIVSYHRADGQSCVSFSNKSISQNTPIVRIHSSCLFSESIGALDCDCAEQLKLTMKMIVEHGHGALIYKQDEGRGVGLENKIRAMALQTEENLTTAQAFYRLGYPPDARDYRIQIDAMKDLGFQKIIFVTANPRKIEAVERAGIEIIDVVQVKCTLNPMSHKYILSKQRELDHIRVYNDLYQNE